MKPAAPALVFQTPADLQPEYANLVRISHSPVEVILEFARLLPGETQPMVVAKLVLTPLAARWLQQVLGDNLTKYEANFGEIKLPVSGAGSLADQLFKPTDEPPDDPREQ